MGSDDEKHIQYSDKGEKHDIFRLLIICLEKYLWVNKCRAIFLR